MCERTTTDAWNERECGRETTLSSLQTQDLVAGWLGLAFVRDARAHWHQELLLCTAMDHPERSIPYAAPYPGCLFDSYLLRRRSFQYAFRDRATLPFIFSTSSSFPSTCPTWPFPSCRKTLSNAAVFPVLQPSQQIVGLVVTATLACSDTRRK